MTLRRSAGEFRRSAAKSVPRCSIISYKIWGNGVFVLAALHQNFEGWRAVSGRGYQKYVPIKHR